jgi:Putative amidase domain
MSAVYNRVLAAGYATKYALHPNTAWIKDIEDCTNFVSQALYFGGWPMTAGDGSDGVTAWYNTSDPDSILGENWGRSSYRRSRTWGAAENFRQFLQFGGRARKCAIDQLTIGDVVQHSANGRASHSMMITGFASSSPSSPETPGLKGRVLLASYHSKDKLNTPLILVKSPYENLFWKISALVPDTSSLIDATVGDKIDRNWSHSTVRGLF